MNDQKSLAIGIIGAGNMGRHHQGAITNYGARVVAVHDVRLEAARELATHAESALATTELDAFFDVDMDGWLSRHHPLSVLNRSRWHATAVFL